ncbi:CbtA family protein [Streptomyces phytophilus]|uniref:CbtA family protein n=1 Tax=Streptomyces phytophilus TaxID=722715 RepID=UPI0015F0054E|nr:CbtA family protein [Streptomyces phytophilus]
MNSAAVRGLLLRGMLVGLGAGVLALVVAYVLGEPQVDAAIEQEAHGSGHGGSDSGAGSGPGSGSGSGSDGELVSRSLQSTAGLATGLLVYGVALGGLAALAVAYALGRVGRFGPRATALLLALGGLVSVYAVPFLKYPANPPGVGDPETVGDRTAQYFLMVLLSVLLAVGAAVAGRRLLPRLGGWYATVAGGAVFAAAAGVAVALLPESSVAVPDGFPGDLLWRFRLASVAVHGVLWVGFGLLFGELAERLVLRGGVGRARGAPVVG